MIKYKEGEKVRLVIIGNSAAGLSAAKTIRKYDQKSEITIISKEEGLAYSRVLLPYVLREKVDYNNIFIKDKAYYEENAITYIEDEVVALDTLEKLITVNKGQAIRYDKLLIATGSHAVTPPIEGLNGSGIYHMWTKNDLDDLLPLFNQKKSVAIIGSGFVSLQAAWAAKCRGLEVSIIEIADRVMPNVLDKKGSEVMANHIVDSGLSLYTSMITEKVERQEDSSFKLHLKNRQPLVVDFVIVGAGVKSNISFIQNSNIVYDRAILVNEKMETNIKDVYAAGDVAAGPTVFGDKHMTHALWPTAVEMGEIAGANMIGKQRRYQGSLNMNVTQMYGVTVASMGIFDDEQIDGSYEFPMDQYKGYIKLCYKNSLIVGACIIGESESVKLLGKLRPIIKKGLRIDCDPEKIESYIDIQAFQNRY